MLIKLSQYYSSKKQNWDKNSTCVGSNYQYSLTDFYGKNKGDLLVRIEPTFICLCRSFIWRESPSFMNINIIT